MACRYWSPIVEQLSPYVPGEQPRIADLTKLNTYETPYGPSPRVIEAIKQCLGDKLRLYPDPGSTELRETAADYYGMTAQQVFVGNGSDEVLAHAFFQQPRPLLFPDITYNFTRSIAAYTVSSTARFHWMRISRSTSSPTY